MRNSALSRFKDKALYKYYMLLLLYTWTRECIPFIAPYEVLEMKHIIYKKRQYSVRRDLECEASSSVRYKKQANTFTTGIEIWCSWIYYPVIAIIWCPTDETCLLDFLDILVHLCFGIYLYFEEMFPLY